MNELLLKEKIKEYSRFSHSDKVNIVTDTSEFMNIKADDVLELAGRFYLVRGEEVEGRFGLDGEPKFWVKKAVDLADGSHKVIKLVFHESFTMHLGSLPIQCFRSPQKESRILDKTRDDPHFMQGFTVYDPSGNFIRIIDKIQGTRFYDYINNLIEDHETYFHTDFPMILDNVILCIEAIWRLHQMEEVHGDIRNDHIFIDRKTKTYIWIDFDYSYQWAENPFGVDLYGLGNILLFTVGKGFHNVPDLAGGGQLRAKLLSSLTADDMSLFFKSRVANLQKLFPYIPDSLNHILLHFSQGTEVFYETSQELLTDLKAFRSELAPAKATSVNVLHG
jgi:hypothetical protein